MSQGDHIYCFLNSQHVYLNASAPKWIRGVKLLKMIFFLKKFSWKDRKSNIRLYSSSQNANIYGNYDLVRCVFQKKRPKFGDRQGFASYIRAGEMTSSFRQHTFRTIRVLPCECSRRISWLSPNESLSYLWNMLNMARKGRYSTRCPIVCTIEFLIYQIKNQRSEFEFIFSSSFHIWIELDRVVWHIAPMSPPPILLSAFSY